MMATFHGNSSYSSFPLLHLSSLVILFFFTQPIFTAFFVNGNEALIGTVCRKTIEPVICSECLKSDPKSQTADVRGLAGIANNCATIDATQLFNETFDFYEKTKDPKLKHVVDACAIRFCDAKDSFLGVQNNLDVEAYDLAKSILINEILPAYDDCLGRFEKAPQLQLPPKLLAGTNIVRHGIDVILGILNYLITG